jgi:3-oxoacyl-[acyl-carrier-protein] synthase-3
MPPAILTNEDLSTFLDTSDEWITTRTGMKERRVSHVSAIEMASVAASRALACAGLDPADVELIIYGGCSNEEAVPNSASGVQISLGATRAAAMDVNTACTSFLYGLSTATSMIRTGVVRNAVVIGVELISRYMDWSNRNVAVLFGDGAAAVVVQATDKEEGVIGTVLGCDAEARGSLRVRGIGCGYAGQGVVLGDTIWDFDGQVIFKRAVAGMTAASARVLKQAGVTPDQIDLVVPHQANLRIIEAVAKYAGIPMERVMLTVQKYGNMSSAHRSGESRRGVEGWSHQTGCNDPDAWIRRGPDVRRASSQMGANASRHSASRRERCRRSTAPRSSWCMPSAPTRILMAGAPTD